MRGKLKKRNETKYIRVVYKNLGNKPFGEIQRSYIQKGFLYAPFHALVDEQGEIHQERPFDVVGSSKTDGFESTIVIYVDCLRKNKVGNAQKCTLESLLDKLKEEYPKAEVSEAYRL